MPSTARRSPAKRRNRATTPAKATEKADAPGRLRLAYVAPRALTRAAYNPRTMTDEARAALKRGIEAFGLVDPIVARAEDGLMLGGHQRLLAAEELGLVEVPVVYVAGVSDQQAAALNVLLNNPNAQGTWDMGKLSSLLSELDAGGFDATLTGFSTADLEDMLTWTGPSDLLTDPDEVPPLPVDPITKPGDLITLGRHRLLCGDALVLAQLDVLMAGRTADMAVTSPPYNQKIDTFAPSGMHREGRWVEKVARLAYADDLPEDEYQQQQRCFLANLFSVVRDGASVFYNHKNRYRDKRVVSPMEWIPGPFALRQEIIWRRPGSVTQNARMFLPCDERIYWLYRGEDFDFDDTTEIKTWSTVWDVALEANRSHAVAFPVALPRRCILASSVAGSIVIDPYAGSGTTLIAAELTGRVCHAMEIDPHFCDVIVTRWENATGQKAVRP